MSTEQEIQEIIKKNLPAQVGDVLKTRLEQAERDANSVANQREQIISKEATIKELEEQLEKYRKFDIRNDGLDKREVELNKIKHDLDLEILKAELVNEKDKSVFAKSIALGLVRNTEYRKTIFDSENQAPYYDSNNNWIQPMPVNKNLDEKKSAE